jgi:ATP/maltotriose-dependent transcriptional regulator MalT
VLILEDYHFIKHERIHEMLAFFIEHLPASLHLVILTRVEPPLPLVRWRAQGNLLEVQSNHLRFSAEETAIFLQQTFPLDLLEALDGAGEWYRYHALFAETLRAEATRRLGEEAVHSLSARASRWYEEHSMLVEAIEAALSAQEFERSAHLIEHLNERSSFTEYHTMLRWLKSLPEPLLQTHPALCFHFALAWLFAEDNGGSRLKIEAVEGLLQMAEKGWQRQGDLVRSGNLSALRATFALLHGHFAPAVVYARQALQFQPLHSELTEDQAQTFPSAWIDWRCGCFNALGLQAMHDGDFDQAHLFLLEGYNLSLKSKNHVFTRIRGRTSVDRWAAWSPHQTAWRNPCRRRYPKYGDSLIKPSEYTTLP